MIDFSSKAARRLLAYALSKEQGERTRYENAFHHLDVSERLRASLRSVLALHGLSELQFAILVLLWDNKAQPLTMAVLAEHAGVSRSAVTDALDKLESHGMAHRLANANDRRTTCVCLSESGCSIACHAMGDYLNVLSEDMDHLLGRRVKLANR